MAIGDFLFNGNPPTQTTTYGSTTQGVPDWYAAYQTGILSSANQNVGQLVNQGWNPATGQQVADLTPDQQAAFQAARLSAGSYLPALSSATNTASGIAQDGGNPLGAAQPYYGQAAGGFNAGLNANSYGAVNPFLQGVQGLNTVGAAQPSLGTASQFAQGAGGQNYLPLAQQYTNAGIANNPLSAAQPYLGAASGTFNDPNTVASYMDPYIGQVNDRLATLAQRNLTENILPSLNSDFIGAGQYGSSRNQEFVSRAARDTQQALLGQQAQNLQAGYNTAGQQFSSDQARLAGLAGTAGGLTAQQQQALLSSGVNLANVGNQATQAQLGAASTLGNIGSTFGNLTAAQQQALLNSGQLAGSASQADTQAKINAALGFSSMGSAAGSLSNQGTQNQLTAANQLANYGQMNQNLGLQGSQALDLIGQEQQGQTQAQMNANQTNALAQQGFTQQQISYLNSILRGTQPPTSVSSTNQGPASVYSPSPLAQVAGAAIGLGQAGKYGP